MKVNLTHNESIITFDDVSRHLELEDERLEAAKSSSDVFMAESSQTRASGSRRYRRLRPKKNGSNPQNKLHHVKNDQAKNPKKRGKKDMSTVVCYNCEKKG